MGCSCCGVKVIEGIDGATPEIGENGNWFINGVDTGQPSGGTQGDQGPQGIQGVPGVGVVGVYVSDGSTPIGGNVYPVGTIVTEFSNGVFFNGGTISMSLNWQNLTLINGYTEAVSAADSTPQYAIDAMGFIHFRGAIDFSGRTANQFADLSAIIPSNTKESVSSIISNRVTADGVTDAYVQIDSANRLTMLVSSDYTAPWFLSSINPLYILD